MRTLHRLRLPAVVAAALVAILSSAAPVAAAEVSSLVNLPFPNDPESIAIDHHGNIFVSAPFANKVLEISRRSTQASTFVTLPGNVLGVRFDDEGNLFAAVLGAGIFEVPEDTATPIKVASPPPGSPEFFWNGMAFDRRGNLYVSESHFGEIWRLSEDGSFTKWSSGSALVGTVLPGPCGLVHPAIAAGFGPIGANGIFFNKRGDLFVNNTDLGTVVRIRVNRDGSAGAPSVIAGPSCDLWGADGGAFDNKGNLFIAANSGNKIIKLDPRGHFAVFSDSPLLHFPTDIAFGGGREGKVAYITNLALGGFADGGIVTMEV
jgi:sugar lactone lactonase YvrE